jgi:hypothetical protein
VFGGVAVGAVVSFVVGSAILRLYPVRETGDEASPSTTQSAAPVGAAA